MFRQFKLSSDLYFSFVIIASSDLQFTTSQQIVNTATRIAKLLGYHGADEPCVKIGEENYRCSFEDRIVAKKTVAVLECDPSFKIKGAIGEGVCKVKSWIAHFSLVLAVILAAGLLLGCICYCCELISN